MDQVYKDDIVAILNNLVFLFKETENKIQKIKIAKEHTSLLRKNIFLFEDDISKGIPEYEVWKNIKGYEGIYQLSNYGRIKSLESFFIKKNGVNIPVYKTENIRKWGSASGYPRIALWKKEKVKHIFIHRLVAFYFIDNPHKYPQVLHIDNNPANPRWDNLRWGTQKQNIEYAVECGRWHLGEKNNKTKLKKEQIPKIRELLLSGMPAYKIAKIFNVTKYPILSIKHGRTWSHIK